MTTTLTPIRWRGYTLLINVVVTPAVRVALAWLVERKTRDLAEQTRVIVNAVMQHLREIVSQIKYRAKVCRGQSAYKSNVAYDGSTVPVLIHHASDKLPVLTQSNRVGTGFVVAAPGMGADPLAHFCAAFYMPAHPI